MFKFALQKSGVGSSRHRRAETAGVYERSASGEDGKDLHTYKLWHFHSNQIRTQYASIPFTGWNGRLLQMPDFQKAIGFKGCWIILFFYVKPMQTGSRSLVKV